MNKIPEKQLEQFQLECLAAQRQLYSDAKKILSIQIILSVPVVILCSVLIAFIPKLAVYATFWGVMVTLLDAMLFNPCQASIKNKAAKIQELFDCYVLELDWHKLKVRSRPDTETIAEFANKYKKKDSELNELKNWYPTTVGKLPLHLARLVCQRSNCWWDAKLRRRYSRFVVLVLIILTTIVSLLGLIIGGMTLEELVLAVIGPLMPAFTLGIRQYKEHNITADNLDNLKENTEYLWEQAINKKITPEKLTIKSRALQDEIYNHRCTNPLIFDWIYRRLRNANEEQMNKAADVLVNEALMSTSLEKNEKKET